MIMYYTYILRSNKNGKLYKGQTSDLQERLKSHNAGKTQSTKHGIPWEIIYSEAFDTRAAALDRERYFKTAAGRRWIKTNVIE